VAICATSLLPGCLKIGAAFLTFLSIPSLFSSLYFSGEENSKSKVQVSVDVSIEKNSGLSFPNRIIDGKETFGLLGLGVRRVSFFRIRTYAVGLYAPVDEVKEQLISNRQSPIDPETLQKDSEFLRLLVSPKVSKVLRLVPSRSVSGSHMLRALSDNLQQPLREHLNSVPPTQGIATGTSSSPSSSGNNSSTTNNAIQNAASTDQKTIQDLLSTLDAVFPGKRTFPRGTPIDFVVNRTDIPSNVSDDVICRCFVDGEEVAQLRSAALVTALFEIYLGPGERCKTPDLRRSVSEGIAKLATPFNTSQSNT